MQGKLYKESLKHSSRDTLKNVCQNRCCKLCAVKSRFRNKINNTVGFVTEGGFLEPEEAVACLGCRGSSHTDALRAGGNEHHQCSPWLSARQPSTSEKPQGSSSLSGLTSSTQMILNQTTPVGQYCRCDMQSPNSSWY